MPSHVRYQTDSREAHYRVVLESHPIRGVHRGKLCVGRRRHNGEKERRKRESPGWPWLDIIGLRSALPLGTTAAGAVLLFCQESVGLLVA